MTCSFCLLYRFGPFAAAVTLGCSPKFRFGNDSQRQKGKHCKMIDRMGKRECMLFFLCSSLNFSLLLSTSSTSFCPFLGSFASYASYASIAESLLITDLHAVRDRMNCILNVKHNTVTEIVGIKDWSISTLMREYILTYNEIHLYIYEYKLFCLSWLTITSLNYLR